MLNRLPLALVLAALTSCTTAPSSVAPTSPAAPAAPVTRSPSRLAAPVPPPGLRLPRTAIPVRYAATVTVVPAVGTLQGEVDIDLTLQEPTPVIWLHGRELTVRSAHLESGGKQLAARIIPGGADVLGFAFESPAPAGRARLHVAYDARISDNEDRGVFKEDEDGASYVFTQFENTEARRAFPCFDEPSFKVPWQLTLRVKKADVAVSNTPVISEVEEGEMKVIRFAETRPLPSYLIAFAVGPFGQLDAGKTGKNNTPVRIFTPRGRQAEAAYAAQSTPALLAQLEGFFGTAYPYEKLDVVSVPRLITFGAMENAGLITFRQQRLLAKPNEDTIAFRRHHAATMAHELAHQWFGDLVTMAWWDDIWLNEGFATWMEDKAVAKWRPEWEWESEALQGASRAMAADSLMSARRVRQTIESASDIDNAFDRITYNKGAAVLTMFESWLGPDRFQKGIHRYLDQHAYGTATSADFLAAVSAEAGRDVGPAFSTFLDQPGVPLVSAELTCGKGTEPRVELTQERYLPAGSEGAPNAQTWQLPICVRYGVGNAVGRACTLLTEHTATLSLPKLGNGASGATRCPDWLLPNEGGNGYYHVAYRPEALDKLLRGGGKQLTVPERLAVLRDAQALIQNGKLAAADALARLPELVKDANPQIVHAALTLVSSLSHPLVPAAVRPNFARFVQKVFGPRARSLGWLPKPGEDEQLRLLRPMLVAFVADRGEDAALIAEANTLSARWLADHGAGLAPDVAAPILSTAAHVGDRALFDRLYTEAKSTKNQVFRSELVEAMRSFRNPSIVKDALAIVLTRELDLRDTLRLLFQDDQMASVGFAFYKQNYDALMAKLPDSLQSDSLYIASSLCDDASRADAASFLKGRADKLTGGPRTAAQVLEGISLCSAQRTAQQANLTAFLKKY